MFSAIFSLREKRRCGNVFLPQSQPGRSTVPSAKRFEYHALALLPGRTGHRKASLFAVWESLIAHNRKQCFQGVLGLGGSSESSVANRTLRNRHLQVQPVARVELLRGPDRLVDRRRSDTA